MPDLDPQVPGEIPGADAVVLAPQLAQPVSTAILGLDMFTDAELTALSQMELNGENREAVLSAIVGELESRSEPAPTPEPSDTKGPAPLGDETTYANRPWSEIDASKIDRAVLTRDGWLMPAPKAIPG